MAHCSVQWESNPFGKNTIIRNLMQLHHIVDQVLNNHPLINVLRSFDFSICSVRNSPRLYVQFQGYVPIKADLPARKDIVFQVIKWAHENHYHHYWLHIISRSVGSSASIKLPDMNWPFHCRISLSTSKTTVKTSLVLSVRCQSTS